MPDHDRSASASPPARPARCTSARPGRRCSTSSSPGTTGGTFVLRLEDTDVARSTDRVRAGHPRRACTGSGITLGRGPGGRRAAATRAVRAVPPDAAAATLRGGRRPTSSPRTWPIPATARRRSSTPTASAQEAAKLPPRYVGRCAQPDRRTSAPRSRGRGPRRRRIRFRVGEGVVGWNDIVRGRDRDRHRQPRRRLRHRPRRRDAALPLHGRRRRRGDGDQPRHPRRGPPLATRPSTSCCSEALGHAVPVFAHLPLILNPDRTKMSKRKSQTAVDDYRAEGFIREALVNYLALLGWSTGHRGGDPLARRARRAVRHRARSRRAARSSTGSASSG